MQLDWNITLNALKQSLPQAQFQNWIEPVRLLRTEENCIVLGVPNRFHQEWVQNHFLSQLSQALREQCGKNIQLELQVIEFEEKQTKPHLRLLTSQAAHSVNPLIPEEQLPISPIPVDEPNLPPFNHPFWEFSYNRVAFQCANLFVSDKNNGMNPVVFLGGVGMGKTHLLSHIGMMQKQLGQRVRYVNFESFTNEWIMSLKSKTVFDFNKKYREETDCLLFDDLHGLAKKMASQEALLHIFNEITLKGGKIAFTTSVSPNMLAEFIEPLKSRLRASVIAEVHELSYEDRLSVLRKQNTHSSLLVDESALSVLANQGQKDVRELLGSLIRTHLNAKLENKVVDAHFIHDHAWLHHPAKKENVTLDEIMALIEHHMGTSRTELVSKSRKSSVAWARQVAMYLARQHTLLPLEEIGRCFGRDHATVIHAYQKVQEKIETQPTFQYEIEFLKRKLESK